jgi:signal transduction histidine kinase
MELMGRLVAGVAHEVRNPLSVIQASIEACAMMDASSAEWSASLILIREQVERLSVLMRDLLELGKPVRQSRLQNESISTLCRTAISTIRKIFPDRVFALDAPEEELTFVRVDPAGLYQVLHNLLENAAQHSSGDAK